MSPDPKERKPTRDPEGSIFKKIIERRTTKGGTRKEIVYVVRVRRNEYDQAGSLIKEHERKRQAASYNDALSLRRRLRDELAALIKTPKRRRASERKYFFDLLDFYEANYVKEAVFAAGKKIVGQKDPVRHAKRMIESYREFFGNPLSEHIDYSLLFDYKTFLMITPYMRRRKVLLDPERSFRGEIVPRHRQRFGILEEYHQRKPATIHRYLARLRRIFSVGVQHDFLKVNPFKQGDPLIIASIEEVRDRICTYEEERAILEVCVSPREHLGDVVVCAIDTFMRENELFSLIGADINFEDRYVRIMEYNAKTAKERYIPLSDRSLEAFMRIRGDRSDVEWTTSRVFEFQGVGRSWYTALRLANIEGLRLHDLRGTGITRMLDAGVPVPIVMKFSGHEKYETFKKYVKNDLQIIQNAATAMSSVYREHQNQPAKGRVPLSDNANKSLSDSSEVTIESGAIN